ncbi:MAG: hypothetical protein ACYDCJ_12890 [Gammaproteobacteria bacterium]
MSGVFSDIGSGIKSSLDPLNLTGLNNGNSISGNIQNTLDPLHLWSGGSTGGNQWVGGALFGNKSTAGMTPEEQLALSQAEPYLAEYQSGKLDPANQGAVNQADTNATSAALQSFANAGMLNSSSEFATTGQVQKNKAGVSTGQAGVSSAIDLGKQTQTQAILQQDLNIGLDYLGIASGDASAQMALQVAQNQQIASDLQSASQSFGQIYGSYQQNQLAAQTASTGGGYDPFVS